MKDSAKAWLMAFVMGILIPGLFFTVTEKILPRNENKQGIEQSATKPSQSTVEQSSLVEKSLPVIFPDRTVRQMDMDTYLTCVLLAEMPVDFHPEALKAQAVVARTYALKRNAAGNKHINRAVCTDPSCCQGYRSKEDFLSKGGTDELLKKINDAVLSTKGAVLTYNGELIEATYFSCSGGRTEDALAVWGTDIPYLQAVDSPGEEQATYYIANVQLSASEFASRLGIAAKGVPHTWLGAVTYTDGGGVDTMVICGKTFSGTTLRKLLGLRSTAFSMLAVGETIYISTKGYGHRVGMSQYGAEAMAVSGSSYQEILAHYYPGTVLSAVPQN